MARKYRSLSTSMIGTRLTLTRSSQFCSLTIDQVTRLTCLPRFVMRLLCQRTSPKIHTRWETSKDTRFHLLSRGKTRSWSSYNSSDFSTEWLSSKTGMWPWNRTWLRSKVRNSLCQRLQVVRNRLLKHNHEMSSTFNHWSWNMKSGLLHTL